MLAQAVIFGISQRMIDCGLCRLQSENVGRFFGMSPGAHGSACSASSGFWLAHGTSFFAICSRAIFTEFPKTLLGDQNDRGLVAIRNVAYDRRLIAGCGCDRMGFAIKNILNFCTLKAVIRQISGT